MNYKEIYNRIIERSKNRILESYKERHHIIPKCIGGDNSSDNLTELSVKEHYVCHHLLVKIYQNTEFISKLVCAFRYMSVDSHNGNRIGLNDYKSMRELYSKYHPLKNEKTKKKLSDSLKQYYKNLPDEKKKVICLNLENARLSMNDEHIKRRNVNSKISINKPEIKEKLKKSLYTYYNNETQEQRFDRLKKQKDCHTEESYKKTSVSLKNFIKSLTDGEKENRLTKSLRNCDNIERGKSISKSKKGKKTKQQDIMGIKYSKMSDDEFELYLKNRPVIVLNRMIKLRNKYLERENK